MKFLFVKLLVLVQFVWAAQAQNKCSANSGCADNLGKCIKSGKTCAGTVDTTAGLCTASGGASCKCCLLPCPTRCTGTCPTGYTLVDNQCLSFNLNSMTAAAAQLACQNAGGRLAKAVDHAALSTYLNANYAGQNFWLGASDVDTEGNWLWFSGGAVDNSIWYPGEPNNANGNEDCMVWWGGVTGYIDEPCTETFNYICEADRDY